MKHTKVVVTVMSKYCHVAITAVIKVPKGNPHRLNGLRLDLADELMKAAAAVTGSPLISVKVK